MAQESAIRDSVDALLTTSDGYVLMGDLVMKIEMLCPGVSPEEGPGDDFMESFSLAESFLKERGYQKIESHEGYEKPYE